MKVFFDTEFTGLHQNTTLISIGCIAENDSTFYGEFTDYDESQVDEWLRENVLDHLTIPHAVLDVSTQPFEIRVKGRKDRIEANLRRWFESFGGAAVEMWSDCLAYDWVLFCELFGGAFAVPSKIYYIPFDLATLFKLRGIDPDVNREEYAGLTGGNKHNALWDAKVIRACYQKTIGGTHA